VRGSHIKLGEGERKVRLGQDSLPNKAETSGDYIRCFTRTQKGGLRQANSLSQSFYQIGPRILFLVPTKKIESILQKKLEKKECRIWSLILMIRDTFSETV
jgi:hypothetical protein